MFCTQCGIPLEKGGKYCSGCGKEVRGVKLGNEVSTQEESVDGNPKNEKMGCSSEKATCTKFCFTECNSCGHILSLEAEFCPNCGLKTEWGEGKERHAEIMRELEIKRAGASKELSIRTTLMLIILILCVICFAYGYCLFHEEYWLIREGTVTSRAALGIFLMIAALVFHVFEVTHRTVRKYQIEKEIAALQKQEAEEGVGMRGA